MKKKLDKVYDISKISILSYNGVLFRKEVESLINNHMLSVKMLASEAPDLLVLIKDAQEVG